MAVDVVAVVHGSSTHRRYAGCSQSAQLQLHQGRTPSRSRSRSPDQSRWSRGRSNQLSRSLSAVSCTHMEFGPKGVGDYVYHSLSPSEKVGI